MVTAAVNLAPSLKARGRLLVACALSLALHVMLLLGVPVNPTGGHLNSPSTILARLEPPAEDADASATAPVPEPLPVVEPDSVKTVTEDPFADPEAKKPVSQPEEARPLAPPPSSPSAGIELPILRDPAYYTPRELDVLPNLLKESEEYMKAEVARLDVRVRVLLLIDEFGVVNEAAVVEAQPAGYEQTVRSVFAALRFTPGIKQNRAVKTRVVLNAGPVHGEGEGPAR